MCCELLTFSGIQLQDTYLKIMISNLLLYELNQMQPKIWISRLPHMYFVNRQTRNLDKLEQMGVNYLYLGLYCLVL